MLGGSFVVLMEKVGHVAEADHGDREADADEEVFNLLGFDGDGH
jgi:hypothetical protein